MLAGLISSLFQSKRVDSLDFDGSTDYLTSSLGPLSGVVDGNSGIFSCWIRMEGGDNTQMRIFGGVTNPATTYFAVRRTTTNRVEIEGRTTAGGLNMDLQSSANVINGSGWKHILCSWNVTDIRHLYMNDVSDLSVANGPTATVDYVHTQYSVGAQPSATLFFNGLISEVYFAPNQFLDFSVTANRRKFITAAGKPAYLGRYGEAPTGTKPAVYLSLKKNAALTSFMTNLGTGGDFSGGDLPSAKGSSSPSD